MDWQAAQNWLVFLPVAGLLGAYYYSSKDGSRTNSRTPEAARRASVTPKRVREDDVPVKAKTKSSALGQGQENGGRSQPPKQDKDKKAPKQDAPSRRAAPPAVVVQNDEPEEIDMSTRQFAQQMAQARKGHQLGSSKGKEQKVKTVKQGSALNTPLLSSGSSQADADDDMSPVPSPALKGGDVSDMLEPTTAGPTTLRVTASTKPQKEKVSRQPKEEVVLSKKQRQNRQKVEEQKAQRAEEERERKALEERQRRAARLARGEPAKNGLGVSKPPTSNAWTDSTPTATTPVNGSSGGPLLDTFDAESTSSSTGIPEASTAATSMTGSAHLHTDGDAMSEEEQVAMAVRKSQDENGWTEVAQPKKGKKKGAEAVAPASVPATKKVSEPTPVAKGKVNGFSALQDQYVQRTDADPSDASNWDA